MSKHYTLITPGTGNQLVWKCVRGIDRSMPRSHDPSEFGVLIYDGLILSQVADVAETLRKEFGADKYGPLPVDQKKVFSACKVTRYIILLLDIVVKDSATKRKQVQTAVMKIRELVKDEKDVLPDPLLDAITEIMWA